MNTAQGLNIWLLLGTLPLALGWFLTNTYPPWLSAWLETSALTSVVLLCMAARQWVRSVAAALAPAFQPPLALLALLVLFSLVLQLATGVMFFSGDAVMVLAYLLAWLLAVYVGQVAAQTAAPQNLDAFWLAVLVSALLSVGLALVQWLDVRGLNIFVLDMPTGGRPFANLGQPNNFCTLCFLGCASLLYLQERGLVRGGPWWLAWCWLSFGMALSQSRTGWLQMVCLVLLLCWLGPRMAVRVLPRQAVAMGAVFVLLVITLPWLADSLLITAGRTLGDQIQGGVRLPYWLSMLEAMVQRPWLGYGWLQTGLAQQLDSTSAFQNGIFEFAHNIALDLIVWTGFPLGLGIIFCCLTWGLQQFKNLNNSLSLITMLALLGVLVHALLEYPLAYAYFLVPFGFLMGALYGLNCQFASGAVKGGQLGHRCMEWLVVFFSILLSFVAHDYFRAESTIRDLRFESARIGPKVESVLIPEMYLLNHLEVLMRYGYRDPEESITKEEWQQTRLVSERFGLSFVMFRYALASGFYGDALTAQNTLAKMCRIHVPDKCAHAELMWSRWRERYPLSIGVIAFPDAYR